MKILAIASAGGHWVQLRRMLPALDGCECVYMSTKESFRKIVPNNTFYTINDFNRNTIGRIFGIILQTVKIMKRENPRVIITTGAAPGLIVLFIGKLFFKKTVWVDSIANVEELSMSGKIASYFADRVYTQWEHLANKKIHFAGNVII